MSATGEELGGAPGLKPLYAKALLGVVPGRGGDELPERELRLSQVDVDRGHLAAYDRVCGFRLSEELPPTYLHVHAFPLAMKLMTERSFPLPLLGLVHVRNRIEQARPVRADERVDLRVTARDLRSTERGTEVDLVAEADAADETVWSSTSTYLRRGGGSGDGGAGERSGSAGEGPGAAGEEPPPAGTRAGPDEAPRPDALWKLPGDLGRSYAAVSGDVNPIHLHSLGARLFGFPRAIAHGMWTKARCLAALEGRLPERITVEVEFKKPVLLPATVAFASRVAEGGRTIDLRDARKKIPHLQGSVRSD